MSKSEIQKLIKVEIGYSERDDQICKNCAHYSEVEGVIDRTWDSQCGIAGVIIITVAPNAT
jgi:hypothetical protein